MSYAYDAYRAILDNRQGGIRAALDAAIAAHKAEVALETEAHAINAAATVADQLAAQNAHYRTNVRGYNDQGPCMHDSRDDIDPDDYDLHGFTQCEDCGEYLDPNGDTTFGDPRGVTAMTRSDYRRLVS